MAKLAGHIDKVKEVISGSLSGRKYEDDELKTFKKSLSGLSKPEVKEYILLCIETKDAHVMKFATAMIEKRKLINWKEHEDIFAETLDCLIQHAEMESEEDDDICYSKFMDKFIQLLTAIKLFKMFTPKLFEMVKAALSSEANRLCFITDYFTEDLPWTQNTDIVLQIFDRIYEIIKENPERNESHRVWRCINIMIIHIYRNCNSNTKQAMKYVNHIAKIFNFCKDQEFTDPDDSDKKTISQMFLRETLEDYLCTHKDKKEVIKPMFAAVKELWECEDDILKRDADNLMTMMNGSTIVELDEDSATVLIDRYISGEDPTAITNFQHMYQANPDMFTDAYLDAIGEAMDGAQDWVLSTTVSFFMEVAKQRPEGISTKTLTYLMGTLKVDATAGVGLMALGPLAEKYPEKFFPHEDEIIKSMPRFKMMSSQAAIVLTHMAKGSEERTAKYIKTICEFADECDSTIKIGLFYSMKQLGTDFPHLLAKYEDYFMRYKKDAVLSQSADALLDVIHGRSLAGVAKDIQETQDDVENLDERVTTTEDNVNELGQEAAGTKVAIVTLEKDVNDQGERLGELEDVVEETVEKVEEIDKKTLSHAPTWAKDVARLMNKKSDHDWRLLGSRLGYTNDDIRNWATQADPCLSMFDEWFATHKTREATHAILKNIEEMNRLDAAMIVENALKQTEDIVEDEEQDYITPPEVFISYQWGVQEEVKLLKKHLEMAGFECWMDIGQMGGGDKLFDKIDKGIRAAKIIICCVTEKYAKSPNCNREVNLSVNLGKPIIPLLMEKIAWPPPGSMGPIFGEYLFIRFFARAGETAGDIRYWPTAKFQELIFQLRYSVVPNEELITDPYTNWQSPPEEVIVIKPKDKNSTQAVTASQNETKNEETMPDVFISYQWGKQPQIKVLYKKLTSMGYTCWLDIMQMGGGDSLYDKIDKGVRNCKVVLTCVTEKYSLSANCRREVSLADALKKPIVPLLLEKITWPPAGPMSMVFTQLLYIDFCKPDDSIQKKWECPQMDELISKINKYNPLEIQQQATADDESNNATIKPGEKQNKEKKQENKEANDSPKPKEEKNEKSSSCRIL